MASGGESRRGRLVDEIVRHGELAYSPDAPAEAREVALHEFTKFLLCTKTLALIPALTTLIQTGRVQPWLRPHLAVALAKLPLRPRGVRHTIEFILSVHPSTAQKAASAEYQTVESQGPSISLSALSSASRLISSPPSDLSPAIWFSKIAPQLLSLLDGEGGLEMIKVASFIIGYGILGRKSLGAPGTAGWKAFAEPILSHIDPTHSNGNLEQQGDVGSEGAIVPLVQPRNVIVTTSKVAEALRRLASLLSSHPNPGLSKRLLDPLLLPLWALSSWAVNDPKEVEDEWRAPARFLLQILLQLTSNGTHLITIAQNLLYQGNQNVFKTHWKYASGPGGGVQIERWLDNDDLPFPSSKLDFSVLNAKVDAFVELVRPMKENDDIPKLFFALCRKWLLKANDAEEPGIVLTVHKKMKEDDIEDKLVEAKLTQRLMDALPDRLISNSAQIIQLAGEVLNRFVTIGEDLDGDDTIAVALSLLNMAFTAPSFTQNSADRLNKDSIRSTLENISRTTKSDTSITAQNLLLLLDFKASGFEPSIGSPKVKDQDLEDRRTYSLALSYLRVTESPPPVRAQGLDLLSGLVSNGSSILDIPATLVLLSSLLQDEEEYIYLRVIKSFILLSIKHPMAVMIGLLERYIDPNEETDLDSRLRLGEALLQVVQKAGQTFTGELARQIGDSLLETAGRRGYRPEHKAEQQKQERLDKRKNKEAEEAWNGPVPQLEDAPDEPVEDPVLAQILRGWDSKQGAEDIRIRASALSIFGSAIEINIAGLGSSKISNAVDLSINILAIEPEPEKAILRRAAILLIMSLVRALDQAQEEERRLGFGFAGQSLEDVLRILRYVQDTDNDGLVRQHAADVIEGLGTWQVKGLLGTRGARNEGINMELEGLAGLDISVDGNGGRKQKPRIEEV